MLDHQGQRLLDLRTHCLTMYPWLAATSYVNQGRQACSYRPALSPKHWNTWQKHWDVNRARGHQVALFSHSA